MAKCNFVISSLMSLFFLGIGVLANGETQGMVQGTSGNPGNSVARSFAGGFNTGAGTGGGNPFDFNALFSSYFAQMQKFHEHIADKTLTSYAITSQNNLGNAKAESSLFYDQPQDSIKQTNENILKQHANNLNNINGNRKFKPFDSFGTGAGFGTGGSVGGASGTPGNGAFASGSITPGGTYQTAAVFPENPNMPNVVNRFGETENGNKGNNGKPYFYGVSSSSQSSSSNVDGKVQQQHTAQTTINDNGKVTTYQVKNP